MVHTDVHQHVAHEAVAVGGAVVEQLAHHGVVEVVGRRVGDGLDHEGLVPQHVGVGRVDVVVDGVLHLGAELAAIETEKERERERERERETVKERWRERVRE